MATKPKYTKTLEDFVNSGETTTITYHSLSLIEKVDNIEFPVFNVIDDYIDELISISKPVSMTDIEKYKYKYRPRLLCEELYGNGELYFIILLINGICDIQDFTLASDILLPPKDSLIECLNKIYKAEKKQIDEYNDKERENSD